MAKTKKASEGNLLEDFEFDSTNVNDFFGIPNTAIEDIPAASKEKQKEKEVDDIDDDVEIEDDELTDDDFSFSDEDDKTTIEEDDKEKPKSKVKSNSKASKIEESEVEIFSSLTKDLKEAGIFDSIEFAEDEEITSEVFFEKFNEELNTRVDNTIQGLMDSLDEDGAAFLKFKSQGGDTREFFKLYGKTTSLPVSDVESEENQKAFLEYYYADQEDLDEEEIDDRINRYMESGKLEKYAKQYFNRIKEAKDEEQRKLTERQAEIKKQQAEQQRQFQTNLKSVISKGEEINDFPIDSKKDGYLVDFLTKPTIDKDTRTYMTGFQKSMRDIFADEKKLILLAKIVASDFDFSSIKKKGETNATKKTLNTLKTKRKLPSNNYEGRRLADYFD